ncbi:Arabinose operon regulatory protein [Roseimaritima multifibrata]|uniref:Arabinose operon regulatory protein n=1 Tax=Roseimaritima multifibrata TaxID=1930274 RepID=A0A517MAP6_9BACT|nr:AraC family transcriptional regulator [Roseimaritima multifibrata]QDS91857.1 Arabinose operon regulatory protein [Roseimaritima multifibrata]
MSNSQPPAPLPAFVSQQVTEARRFFLNLNPNRKLPLAIVCGGVERMRPDYFVERTDFPYYAIELVAEGEGTLTVENKEYPLSVGSLFSYGPRTSHSIRNQATNGMRKYYLDFVGTGVVGLLKESGLLTSQHAHQPIAIHSPHHLTDLFEILLREASSEGSQASRICETITELLFLKIKQSRTQEGNDRPRSYATYERIRRHIDENFLALHTIQQIAAQTDVTPVYLSRLFKRFADFGAYQYLLRRKMNYAAGLLMNEEMLVKEVAQQMEFADAFQFSRAFKRVYGISPKNLTARTKTG